MKFLSDCNESYTTLVLPNIIIMITSSYLKCAVRKLMCLQQSVISSDEVS